MRRNRWVTESLAARAELSDLGVYRITCGRSLMPASRRSDSGVWEDSVVTRFADRMAASTYTNDPVVGVFEKDPDEEDALWISERLFLRVSRVAAAYELHTLPVLGVSDPVRLNRLQCKSLLDELAFVAERVDDPLVTDVVQSVSEYLTARVNRPTWDGFVTFEGE